MTSYKRHLRITKRAPIGTAIGYIKTCHGTSLSQSGFIYKLCIIFAEKVEYLIISVLKLVVIKPASLKFRNKDGRLFFFCMLVYI
jgi:hypothetical protein